MNLIDIIICVLLAFFILAGYYRGFLATLFSLAAFVLSVGLGFLLLPLVSNAVKADEGLYGAMLNYTEGAEYVGDVELSRTPVSNITQEQLNIVVSNPDLPYPMGVRISENVAKETFAGQNVNTLGEYFNLTIVNVFINILAFLVLFIGIYILLSFALHLVDYARKGLPVLQTADGFIGAGIGLLRGFLILFVLFMLMPIVLSVIHIDAVEIMVDQSFFGKFFCESNLLLHWIPGT